MCRMYPNCEPSVAWRYVAEHSNGRCRALMCFGLRRLARVRLPPGLRCPLGRRLDQPGQVGSAAPHLTSRHLAAEPLARLERLAHFSSTIHAHVRSAIRRRGAPSRSSRGALGVCARAHPVLARCARTSWPLAATTGEVTTTRAGLAQRCGARHGTQMPPFSPPTT